MPFYSITDDGLFYLKDDGEWICLTSFWNFYKNIGALPIQARAGETRNTLPVVLARLQELYGIFAGEGKSAEEELVCMTAVSMVFDQAMLGYRPLRILQEGGGSVLSAMLARAARYAHPESLVYAVSKAVYDDAFFYAMNRLGEARDTLRHITIDTEDSILRGGLLDMAVLSGEETHPDPDKTLGNMLRLIRTGGYLICLTRGDAKLRERVLDLPGEAPEIYAMAGDNDMLIRVGALYST